MDEALPVVGVDQCVAHLAAALHVGNAPVVPDPLAALALVLAERNARRTDIAPMTRHHQAGVGALATELIDYVGGLAPVGIDHRLTDLCRSVKLKRLRDLLEYAP